jgi:hypothetical protein
LHAAKGVEVVFYWMGGVLHNPAKTRRTTMRIMWQYVTKSHEQTVLFVETWGVAPEQGAAGVACE